jgi:hypothetical protein
MGNIVRTHWEPGKNEKKYSPHHPKLKRKKARHLVCMLGPSHLLHEISLPKEFITILAWADTLCKEHTTYSTPCVY